MNKKLKQIRKECLDLKKQLDKKQNEFEKELDKYHKDNWFDRELDSASLGYDLMDDSKKDHLKRIRKAVYQ